MNWYKFSNTSDGVLKVFCYRKMDKTTGTSWGLGLLGGGGYSKDSWGWQAVILIWCCEADSKKKEKKRKSLLRIELESCKTPILSHDSHENLF